MGQLLRELDSFDCFGILSRYRIQIMGGSSFDWRMAENFSELSHECFPQLCRHWRSGGTCIASRTSRVGKFKVLFFSRMSYPS